MTNKEREELAAAHPDAWIPVSVGEVLQGEVSDLNIGYSDASGVNYPILTVTDENGVEVKVHGFATALHNEIFTKQPIPGEQVTIVYHGQGEAKVKGQSAPEIYRLRIAGRSPEAYARMYALLRPRGRQNVPILPPGAALAAPPAVTGSPQA